MNISATTRISGCTGERTRRRGDEIAEGRAAPSAPRQLDLDALARLIADQGYRPDPCGNTLQGLSSNPGVPEPASWRGETGSGAPKGLS